MSSDDRKAEFGMIKFVGAIFLLLSFLQESISSQ